MPDPKAFIEARIAQGESTLRNVRNLAVGAEPPVGSTPRELAWRDGRASLWRYGTGDADGDGPPVLIVHSLVSKAFILDLLPGNSVIEAMLERGLTPYLLEWGEPDARDADNTLVTYCDRYIPAATSAVLEDSGVDELVMLGYCFGATLLQLALANPDNGLPCAGLATMAAPLDFHALGLLVEVLRGDEAVDVESLLDATGNLPTEPIARAFRVLRPTNQASAYVDLLSNIDDERWIVGYRAMNKWIEEQVPFPGGVMLQAVPALFDPNALVGDGVDLDGTRRRLADIECPVLVVAAEGDHVVPIDSALPAGVSYGTTMTVLRPDVGHVGLVAGRQASTTTVPAILDWLEDHVPG